MSGDEVGQGHLYPETNLGDHGYLHQGNVHVQQQQIIHSSPEDPDTKAKRALTKTLNYEGATNRLDQLAQPNIPPASFEWVWETPLAAWLAQSDPFFWITGRPGSGKSSLMYFLTRTRKTQDLLPASGANKRRILEFFFDFRAGQTMANDLKGLLCSFLAQLRRGSSEVEEALTRSEKEIPISSLSTSGLEDLTCRMLDLFASGACAFIDGLDEFHGDHFELADTLIRLQDRTGMKMILASRSEFVFKTKFAKFPLIQMHEHNEPSIALCIDRGLERGRLALLDVDSIFTPELRRAILDRADGVIIWVRLAIDELLRAAQDDSSTFSVRAVLDSLPDELQQMYIRILARKSDHGRLQTSVILSLLTLNGGELNLDILRDYAVYLGLWDQKKPIEAFLDQVRILAGVLVDILPWKAPDYDFSSTDKFGNTPERVRLIHETLRSFVRQTILTDQEVMRLLKFDESEQPYIWMCANMLKEAETETSRTPKRSDSRQARHFGPSASIGEAVLVHVMKYLKKECSSLDENIDVNFPLLEMIFATTWKLSNLFDPQDKWALFSPPTGLVANAIDFEALRQPFKAELGSIYIAGAWNCPAFAIHSCQSFGTRSPEICWLALSADLAFMPSHFDYNRTNMDNHANLMLVTLKAYGYLDSQLISLCTNLRSYTGKEEDKCCATILAHEEQFRTDRNGNPNYLNCTPICTWFQTSGATLSGKVLLRVLLTNFKQLQDACPFHDDDIFRLTEGVQHMYDGLARLMCKSRISPVVFRKSRRKPADTDLKTTVKMTERATEKTALHKIRAIFQSRRKKKKETIVKPTEVSKNSAETHHHYVNHLFEHYAKYGKWPSPVPPVPKPSEDANHLSSFVDSIEAWEFDSSGMVLFTDEEKSRLKAVALECGLTLPRDLR